MTGSEQKTPIYLKNYTPPEFEIQSVNLKFDLFESYALVINKMVIIPKQNKQGNLPTEIKLNGKELTLVSLSLNGQKLNSDGYQVTSDFLSLRVPATKFELEIETRIEPQNNKTLQGLYKSKNMFCTQNEAEGFRKITYYLDRPDVMSVFTATVVADKAKYPVLLSNGNLIHSGSEGEGRHFAEWHDPFKKPCYLFALVAGNLACVSDSFTTISGRHVLLEVYVDAGNENRATHAMKSLKDAMKWDEETFGREYDLDRYMIVAVDDFNFGAMENKGLNLFNSSYVLASEETATDRDYELIQAVVGHEYFHNWTGNRITLRDWFQISLKEGLTVFREQEFSADMNSRPVQRIDDAVRMRSVQFLEDSGPFSHPVQPPFYLAIDNFYTATVYEKGGEIIRMLQTILGNQKFLKGMDLYFKQCDGKAATTEDFVKAMEEVSGENLTQFRLWYTQAGTPLLKIKRNYLPSARTLELEVEQILTPEKKPMDIPLEVALLDAKGTALSLELEGEHPVRFEETKVLRVKNFKQIFRFRNIHERPLTSLLRRFSAPVRIESDLTDKERLTLFEKDSDSFSKWEAGYEASTNCALKLISRLKDKKNNKSDTPPFLKNWLLAMGKVLEDQKSDGSFLARLLQLPSETDLAQLMTPIDVDSVHFAYSTLQEQLGKTHEKILLERYEGCQRKAEHSKHERALMNRCLALLVKGHPKRYSKLAFDQFQKSSLMTLQVGALVALSESSGESRPEVESRKGSVENFREEAFAHFYRRWKNDPVVINKWFQIQAVASTRATFERVQKLAKDPTFSLENPNRVFSLLRSFATGNPYCFHDASGGPYRYIVDRILEIDRKNPNVAAHLMGAFSYWRKLDHKRQSLAEKELKRLKDEKGVSRNVFEMVSKSLG